MPPTPGLGALGALGGPPPGPSPQNTAVMGALQNRVQQPGASLAQQSAQAQGADPSMILRQLEMINQILGLLFIRSFQTFPNVANQISQTMKQLNRALKEAQDVGKVNEVVGKAEETTEGPPQGGPPPITFGPAQMGLPPGVSGGVPM